MGISFGSINTGLPKDIVKQILEAERIPINNMEVRKAKIGEKKGLVDELTGLVESVSTVLAENPNSRSLRELSADYREDIINLSVDKNIAEPASYQFEVVQLAGKSSAMSSGFEDPEKSNVGVGFIQYYLPDGENVEIYVDSNNSSLNGIAKLINADPENGLRATVVNDGSGEDSPWRLILSLESTGDEELAEFPYFYFVDGEDDLYVEFERPAQDAIVRMDGFEIELPANKANDLIPGVAIDLKKAAPGEEFTIQIKEDVEAISGKVQALVDGLNEILRFINQQNNLDENSDTSRTLGGDIVLQSLESRIRSTVFREVMTEFGPRRLGDIGVTFKRDGLLEFDDSRFTNVVQQNFKLGSQILSGYINEDGIKSPGFIDNLNNTVGTLLRNPDGLLRSRKNSIQGNIDQIDRRIQSRERILQRKEQNLKDKFARLEGTIARIRNQGAGIAALGASAQAQNPVQQLG